MEVTTIRLPEDMLGALESEAEEYGFPNRTEYMRAILEERERILEEHGGDESVFSQDTQAGDQQLQERVDELAERVDKLEQQVSGDDRHDDRERDYAPPAEDVADIRLSEGEPSGSSSGESDETPTPEPSKEPIPDAVTSAIRGLDLSPPDGDVTIHQRYEALEASWRAVRSGEATERKHFKKVHQSNPAGLEFNSWYDNFVSRKLRDLPGVEHDGSTRNPWQSVALDEE